MYVDKLDGKIIQQYFDRQSDLWRDEQSKLLAQIATHQNANVSYIDCGVKILELAQRAGILYETQSMQEKRRILRFVLSNSVRMIALSRRTRNLSIFLRKITR